MIKYKLTDQNMRTYGEFQWEVGRKMVIENQLQRSPRSIWDGLCSPRWFHFYDHFMLAFLYNRNHAEYLDPRFWEVEIGGKQLREELGRKAGCTELTLLREIEPPTFTTIQATAVAIHLSLELCDHWEMGNQRAADIGYTISVSDEMIAAYAQYRLWANNWLTGVSREHFDATILNSASLGEPLTFREKYFWPLAYVGRMEYSIPALIENISATLFQVRKEPTDLSVACQKAMEVAAPGEDVLRIHHRAPSKKHVISHLPRIKAAPQTEDTSSQNS